MRYWGVGNESWGCGGNFTPEEYAAEYRRFTAWVPSYGVRLAFIGSGPNGGDLGLDAPLLHEAERERRRALGALWGWALHHYSWNVSGGAHHGLAPARATPSSSRPNEWYELLHEADRDGSLITDHWAVMGEIDRRTASSWWWTNGAPGTRGTEVASRHLLGQQNTMRDAVLAALTLDTFHRHADKVAMANIAQLVNCLQSLFLAHEDKFVPTPTYHVFDMYGPHVGGQSVRTLFSAPPISYDA